MNFLTETFFEALKRFNYAILHMNELQWSIVCFVAVAFGFLALRSHKIAL